MDKIKAKCVLFEHCWFAVQSVECTVQCSFSKCS